MKLNATNRLALIHAIAKRGNTDESFAILMKMTRYLELSHSEEFAIVYAAVVVQAKAEKRREAALKKDPEVHSMIPVYPIGRGVRLKPNQEPNPDIVEFDWHGKMPATPVNVVTKK